MLNGIARRDRRRAAARPSQARAAGTNVAKGERPQVDMTPLIQLITASIAPGTWRVHDHGADITRPTAWAAASAATPDDIAPHQPIGSITPFFLSISLIIRHTAEVHDQVADLLRQLRRLQDLQVSIEVRFITVSDNFYEQIGVDFDFQIQSKAVGKKSTLRRGRTRPSRSSRSRASRRA